MEQWSSRVGFVLAAIGAAVGLGNIWRFPAVVGQNGGGAYLVPYLIAAAAFALPLLIFEISVGRSLKADVVTAFRQVHRRYEVLGWFVGGSVLAVLSYYLVITGWVLAFFLTSATGDTASFTAFTSGMQPVAYFVFSAVAVGAIVTLGVQSGIERMAKILIPLTFVVLLGLVGYAATLPGFQDGLRFFLTPDFTVLSEPRIWSAAFGQVFFSFSVGMGVLLTYGSYLSTDADVPRSAAAIAAADLLVAVLAGVVIFSVVFTFGVPPTAGTELAFSTLPAAFDSMAFGGVVAVLFFGLLFFAAIAPSVSMLEVGVAGVMRSTGWSRRKASAVTTAVVLAAGLPSALSYTAVDLQLLGRPFLDVLDASVGAYGLPIGAVAIIYVFAWRQDDEVVENQVGDGAVLVLVKYVVPLVLATVTAASAVGAVGLRPWKRLPDAATLTGGETALAAVGVLAILTLTAYLLRQLRLRRRERVE